MSLQRLYDLDRWSTQFPGQLNELLHDTEYVDGFQKLPKGELVELVNYLNSVRDPYLMQVGSHLPLSQVLDRLDSTSDPFRKCLHALQTICHSKMILPTTFGLARVQFPPGNPLAYGGFSDTYRGIVSEEVCIKQLRISVADREKVKQVPRSLNLQLDRHPDKPEVVL